MIVVSDTSPLNYLILIRETDLLPKLFSCVILSSKVPKVEPDEEDESD